ncbi:uncharacterized protein LOC114752562, partial [Neltuma alba]|uniref:uncharacterized protein LOC114752562 n=1 Tax=Neltuma alba TaxID=207710 RepID=UPI0010A54E87
MSTQTVRGPAVRSGRRRKTVLNLDLNCFPPSENQEQGGPSTQLVPREVQAGQQLPVAQPVMIDVEAIEDDDVVESSPRAFAEAKNNFRRNRRRTIVDVDLGNMAILSCIYSLSCSASFHSAVQLIDLWDSGRIKRSRVAMKRNNKLISEIGYSCFM